MNRSMFFALLIVNSILFAMQQPARVYNAEKTNQLKLLLNKYGPCKSVPISEVQDLVLEGADPDVRADSGYYKGFVWTCVVIEADKSEHSLLAVLLNNGANPNIKMSYFSPLMRACYDNNYEGAQLLIRYGAQVRKQEIYNTSPLMCVLGDLKFPKENRNTLLKLLLDNGAALDINVPDNKGNTPLSLARNNQDILALFGPYLKP